MKALLGGVLIFLLIGAALYFYSDQEKGTENIDSSYINETYGISFKYPNNYLVHEREVGNAERGHYNISLFEDTPFVRDLLAGKVTGTEAPPSISIDIFQNDLDKQTLWGFIRGTNNSNWKLSDETYASTTVDGSEAVKYTWDGLYRGDSVVFVDDTDIVMLSVTYHAPEDQIRRDFQTVISSFTTNN